MRTFFIFLLLLCIGRASGQNQQTVMDGFPPRRSSQVTFKNYNKYPFSQWAFRNAGAPLPTLMVPRNGDFHHYKDSSINTIGTFPVEISDNKKKPFEKVFEDNNTDGIIVLKNNVIVYEKYWNGLSKDYQHIWFSVTKSITSTLIGILVNENKVNLNLSPANYISELKGSAYQRVGSPSV